jgi:hypothetical protein
VQGTTTSTPTGSVAGIRIPNTGGGPESPAGDGLLSAGLFFLSAAGLMSLRRKRD